MSFPSFMSSIFIRLMRAIIHIDESYNVHACKMSNICISIPKKSVFVRSNGDHYHTSSSFSYTRRNKGEPSSRKANRSCICYNEASRKSILHKLSLPFFPVSFLEQAKPLLPTFSIVIISK